MKHLTWPAAGGLLLLLAGCDYYDRRLLIRNQHGAAICVETENDTVPTYPAVNQSETYLSHLIQPGDSVRPLMPGKNAWAYAVARSTNKQLNFFVYSADSVRAYHNMDSLNRKRGYQRLSFSLAELEARNWTVVVK